MSMATGFMSAIAPPNQIIWENAKCENATGASVGRIVTGPFPLPFAASMTSRVEWLGKSWPLVCAANQIGQFQISGRCLSVVSVSANRQNKEARE